MKQEYQDRIDDYLLHRMSDKNKRAFENEVSLNEELREQFEFTKSIYSAINSRNEKLAAMMEWEDDGELSGEDDYGGYAAECIRKEDDYKRIENEYSRKKDYVVTSAADYLPTGSGYDYHPATPKSGIQVRKSSPVKKLLYVVSGLAAVIVVGFFLNYNFGVFYSPRESPLFSKINDVALRAGSDNQDIEVLLSQQRYEDALVKIDQRLLILQSAISQSEQDTLLAKERFDYDLQVFMEKKDDLTWLKVHALIGLKKREEALKLLNNLRCDEGYYQKIADSLYIQLNN